MRNNEMPSHHGVEKAVNGKYPNQTLKLLIERASCRSFSNREIPSDMLDLILSAGIHAPTGGNVQPYSIIKIEDDETKQKLAEMCGQGFIGEAPVLLLFCIDWHRIERWAKLETAPFTATSSFPHFWISFIDTIICAQNICTATDSLGLGSVYIGSIVGFFSDLQDMFQLPKGVFPVVLLCLGYPKAKPIPREKLAVQSIVHAEKYHEIEDRKLMDAFNEKYPDLKVEITKERLKTISKVCRKVHGKDFAKMCLDKIKKTGYITPAQRYFGLHYRADLMPKYNDMYLKVMEEFGFNWFKKYHPPKDKAR
ncbi:MAG: nitroreductase family protein [Candidatus Bathyarchaeota archaeon]|nr:nitroreductase family protein [Candidatus Bathyarchaeota archaeon]MDH5780296.1 nitroreductase family protein [Candidatus Bathyarchaeota archaeon]